MAVRPDPASPEDEAGHVPSAISSFRAQPTRERRGTAALRVPYWICMPEMARAMTSRWISEVPSKIV
jgi:hypothetical protein